MALEKGAIGWEVGGAGFELVQLGIDGSGVGVAVRVGVGVGVGVVGEGVEAEMEETRKGRREAP